MRASPALKRPPILMAFAMLFAAVLYIYPQYLAPSFAGYQHVVKLTAHRDAYDFADCVVEQNKGNPNASMQYLGRSIKGPPRKDIVLRSSDKVTFINIYSPLIESEGLSIIVRAKSDTDGRIIAGIRKCVEE